MIAQNTYYVIGLMSGSSLDGLDICYVKFSVQQSPLSFEYKIIQADCIEYDIDFRNNLRNLPNETAFNFAKMHTQIGHYFGKLTAQFIAKNKIEKLDFIVSHGQTIFHQPNFNFTTQIGCGAAIAQKTNTKVICDLRTNDVAYNGQGAPIVPITEKYLFKEFSIFLNLGGIANIAIHQKNNIIAYDICAANTILNYLAKQKNAEYDKDGMIAKNGIIDVGLLIDLNQIDFCKKAFPKSLGTEYIVDNYLPIIESYNISIEDKMATCVEHIAIQIAKATRLETIAKKSKILVTGGGAFNTFLIERIESNLQNFVDNLQDCNTVLVSDFNTIQYKEALAMAFFGLLRILEIPNCLSTVTGAKKDVIGGAIYLP